MSKCIIIAAMGLSEAEAAYIRNLSDDSYIICADAGYEHTLAKGLRIDMVLGDFDSLKDGLPEFQGSLAQFPSEKDDTDTLLAVKHGLQLGYTEFLLFGVLGGRLDHTFANIATLSYLCMHHASAWLISEENCATMIKDSELSLKKNKKYTYLSVFAYNDHVEGVEISGCKYAVKDFGFTLDFPLGVSNKIIDETALIRVRKGQLLIIMSK